MKGDSIFNQDMQEATAGLSSSIYDIQDCQVNMKMCEPVFRAGVLIVMMVRQVERTSNRSAAGNVWSLNMLHNVSLKAKIELEQNDKPSLFPIIVPCFMKIALHQEGHQV